MTLNKIKNIAVFTSIRSEYGLLKPVLDKIIKETDFNLLLLIGGAHLLDDYGMTKNQIVKDGFKITAEFDFLKNDQSPDFISKSMGTLQIQLGEWLINHKPDILIVLGDRFELMPVVSVFLMNNIPIAHISGGDVTEGAVDNQIRNAITKMAHLHFPATEIYKQNIIKMGEEEWRICVSGEPGLDDVLNTDYYSKEDLFNELGLKTDRPVICVTFHPETISDSIDEKFVENLFLKILNEFDYQILVTASNFDKGGKEINDKLVQLATQYPSIVYVKSLGQRRYYSLLKYAELMLGNSSSGLVEAQSFNLPVINAGNRQAGRLANKNVYHVGLNHLDILKGMRYVVSKPFKQLYIDEPNIYGDGFASDKIISILKQVDLKDILIKKSTF